MNNDWPRFTVTYVQEVTQTVSARDIEAAATFARQTAKDRQGMRVLSVYADAVALPPPA